MWRSLFTASLLLFCCSAPLSAKLEVKNLFSGRAYLDLVEDDPWQQGELLWQPELYARIGDEEGVTFSGNISLQSKLDLVSEPVDLYADLYRLWGSVALPGTDLRVGLQKLNFGTARIIRPEQWFDQLRVLDPLEETEGVNAAVLKHYFGYRSSAWVWGVLTEAPVDNLEYREDAPDQTNLGARVEFPVLDIETGLSFNTLDLFAEEPFEAKEYKLGMDLRYDGDLGIWLEGAVTRQIQYPIWSNTGWNGSLTLGADYTIGIGNGLYLLQETNFFRQRYDYQDLTLPLQTRTALLLSYAPGILDNVQFLSVYDYEDFLNISLIWRRTYDYWSWELGTDTTLIRGFKPEHGLFLRLNYNI